MNLVVTVVCAAAICSAIVNERMPWLLLVTGLVIAAMQNWVNSKILAKALKK